MNPGCWIWVDYLAEIYSCQNPSTLLGHAFVIKPQLGNNR